MLFVVVCFSAFFIVCVLIFYFLSVFLRVVCTLTRHKKKSRMGSMTARSFFASFLSSVFAAWFIFGYQAWVSLKVDPVCSLSFFLC